MQKDQNTESYQKNLVLIVQGIGLLVTLITLFLGFLYTFNGNLFISAALSLLLIVSMYYMIDYFIKMKIVASRKGNSNVTRMLIGLYIIVSLPVTFISMHFFNVDWNEKPEIISNAKMKLDGLQKLDALYDREISTYLSSLELKMTTNFDKLINEIDTYSAIDILKNTPFNLPSDFLNDPSIDKNKCNIETGNFIRIIKSKFSEEKVKIIDNLTGFITISNGVLDSWSHLEINSTLNEIDSKLAEHYKGLSDLLKKQSQEERELIFDIEKYAGKTLIDQPLALWRKYAGLSLLLLVLIFQVLLILPYLLAPSPKYEESIWDKLLNFFKRKKPLDDEDDEEKNDWKPIEL